MWWLVCCLLIAAVLRLPQLEQFPPGLHYDEAANAILSADIGLRGERPVFIASYTGKETLFFYVAGLLMAATGETVFALRLASAFLGMLTIAATYRLVRDMWPHGRTVAVLAAALLATSFWHVLFSRLGFRAISQPLLQALTLVFLWRACRAQTRQHWLILSTAAGICLGLTAYTYLAARLFPVLLLLGCLPLLWQWRIYLPKLTSTAVVGAITLTPLLNYFVANPDSFWVRISQVAPAEEGLTLGESFGRSLAMFVWSGDPYWRFNLPSKPLFEWWTIPFLLIGFITLLLYQWGKDKTLLDRSARVIFLLTPFIMILPTALATNEIVPSNLRAIGLIPFVFIFPAMGVALLLKQTRSSLPTEIILATVLLGQGGFTYQNYFNNWGTRADVYYENDTDLTAVSAHLAQSTQDDASQIYIAAPFGQHPTIAFTSADYDRSKWLITGNALVVPNEGAATYVFPHSAPAPAWAADLLANSAQETSELGPDGEPIFTVYHQAQPLFVDPPIPIRANFGFAVQLLGYDIRSAVSGNEVDLILYWQVDGVPPANWRPFVHIEDHWGYRWGQIEPDTYATSDWSAGDKVIQQISVPLRDGAPPDRYDIKIGFFDTATGQAIARFDDDSRYAGTSYTIETIRVSAGEPPATITPPINLDQQIVSGLNLVGHEQIPSSVGTGEPFDVALWWRAETETDLPPLRIRYEIYNSINVGKTLWMSPPVRGGYPFPEWERSQFVIDRQTLQVPINIDAGRYRLQARILNEIDDTLAEISLGELDITQSDRSFTIPDVDFAAEATFGGEINLVGYQYAPNENSNENGVELTLVWQATSEPAADYTVFVHILNDDGTCCLWQQDSMPQAGAKLTSRWLEGEVIIDTYQIAWSEEVLDGEYGVEIGLYIAESGQRLGVTTEMSHTADAVYLQNLRR